MSKKDREAVSRLTAELMLLREELYRHRCAPIPKPVIHVHMPESAEDSVQAAEEIVDRILDDMERRRRRAM